jgi:replicative DNA helicase
MVNSVINQPEVATKIVEAEIACLGAALIDPQAAEAVVASLRESDFTLNQYVRVFRAMRHLVSCGEPVDRLTVATDLRHRQGDTESPSTFTLDLETAVPTAANVRHYITIVRGAAIRRQARAHALAFAEHVTDPDRDVAELVTGLTAGLEEAVAGVDGAVSRTLVPVRFGEALKAWERSLDEEPEPRVRTPFPALTHYLDGGFGPGEFTYLGAETSIGKTALALELACAAAAEDIGVLIVTLEMVKRQLVRRVISQTVRISARNVKRGEFTSEEWRAYQAMRENLLGLPIWLQDQAVSLTDIVGLVNRWAFEPKLGFLIVDYLQLVSVPAESRRTEVETVSRGLKTLARQHGIPVLCLSSLSRLPAEVRQKRPTLARLRESASLGYDADIVMFLYREDDMAEETECIIRKQRDGAIGTVHLRFRPEYVAFEQAEAQEQRA